MAPRPVGKNITLKEEVWAIELPRPPEVIRLRWLGLIENLRVGWRTPIELEDRERRFARNIVRWIMNDNGARRSLPAGYAVQAWVRETDIGTIVVVRTR